MLRKSLIPLALAVAALCALPALARGQEIVHFTNGTTMTVESHMIEDDMVRVNLGGDSYMAFPMNQIDKIETARGEIAIPREGMANRIVPRAAGSGDPGTVPGYKRRDQWQAKTGSNAGTEVDDNGVAIFRPFGEDAPPNKRRFGVTGRREIRNVSPSRHSSDGVIGATRVGSRYVLPPKMQGGKTRQPTGLAKGTNIKSKKKDD